MRFRSRFSNLVSLGVFTTLVACGRETAEKLSTLDQEMGSLVASRPREDDPTLATIEQRIRSDQELITSLSIEADIQRSTLDSEIGILQARQAEARDRFREDLSNLNQQITQQEQVVLINRQNLLLSLDPPGTQGRTSVENEYNQSVQRLFDLRSQHTKLVAAQQSDPEQIFEMQSRVLENHSTHQWELASIIESARRDIAEQTLIREKFIADQANREKRIQALQAERASLMPGPKQAE